MFSLTPLHTFALDYRCQNVLALHNEGEILHHLPLLRESPYWILGEGSNCVFVADYAGTIARIQSQGIEITEHQDQYVIAVAAGENWHNFVLWCHQRQVFGFENLALIPGTVGAAPIQNIGAYGVELEQFVQHVDAICVEDGKKHRFTRAECQFGYRDSLFKKGDAGQWVITQVTFALPKAWQPQVSYGELSALETPTPQNILDKVIAVRQSKLPDPAKVGNAGSFFKNPVIHADHYKALQREYPSIPGFQLDQHQVKVPAAWLIDTLGFKGQQENGIGSHSRQPLVLINEGHGDGPALLSFARKIRDAVLARFDVRLHNEVRLIGINKEVVL